jgi:hypothetical protein
MNTISKLDRLRECERIVKRGSKTFMEVGNALAEIRDGKLWREAQAPNDEAGYASFDDYTQRRFGFSKSYASRLISGLKAVEKLPIGNINEAQARELAAVPAESRKEVYDAASEATDGKPTARAIREAAERLQSDSNAPAPEDDSEPVQDDEPPRNEAEEPEEDFLLSQAMNVCESESVWLALGAMAELFQDLSDAVLDCITQDTVRTLGLRLENLGVAIRAKR